MRITNTVLCKLGENEVLREAIKLNVFTLPLIMMCSLFVSVSEWLENNEWALVTLIKRTICADVLWQLGEFAITELLCW